MARSFLHAKSCVRPLTFCQVHIRPSLTRTCHFKLLSSANQASDDVFGLPAHLVYDVENIRDVPTLLLVARSAATSRHTDAVFWRASSLLAQRLLPSEEKLRDLATFTNSAAAARHCDFELMYNVGDMAASAAGNNNLDSESLTLVLRSYAQLALRHDRVLGMLEKALLELLQQSRATSECLSSSLLSVAELHAACCLPTDDFNGLPTVRLELIDGAARVALEHMSFFSARQLCTLLQAMSLFKVRGDRQVSALLLGMGQKLARQASELGAEECAAAAKAFAVCRVHDERMLTTLASRLRDKEVRACLTPQQLADVLYGFAKFTSQDIALLDLLSVEARRHLHTFDISLMSSTLASLAKAGVSCPVLTGRAVQMLRRPTEEGIHSATHSCDLNKCSINELSNLTMAFGKFQVRDPRLYDKLAESFLTCGSDEPRRGVPSINTLSSAALVNIVHAFAKVHMAPVKLFGVVMRVLVDGPREEMTTRDAVKLMHAVAKIDYSMPQRLREKLMSLLGPDRLTDLGVFDLLKLAAASKKLGLEILSLESQVGTVLPFEPHLRGEHLQSRRSCRTPRRKSARKQKWTW